MWTQLESTIFEPESCSSLYTKSAGYLQASRTQEINWWFIIIPDWCVWLCQLGGPETYSANLLCLNSHFFVLPQDSCLPGPCVQVASLQNLSSDDHFYLLSALGAIFTILWCRWGDVCFHSRICRLLLSDRNEQPGSGMSALAEWDHRWLWWGKSKHQNSRVYFSHKHVLDYLIF